MDTSMRLATLRTNTVKWMYFIVFLFTFIVFANYVSIYASNLKIENTSVSPTPVTNKAQVLGMFAEPSVTTTSIPSVDDVFDKVNAQRVKNGFDPLIKNSVLTEVALARARDMNANSYYAHEDSQGLFFYDLLKQKNYTTGFACENLDMSFSASTSSYVADWMNSRNGHRECLLDSKVTDAGYALVAYGDQENPNDEKAYLVVAIHAEIN